MGTTNILDLNNRLTKVEKENMAQNSYTSLKNKPKINGNLLTGDKTGTQLGLAEAQDIGDLSALTTTDKSSAVGAINEVAGHLKTEIITGSGTTNDWGELVTQIDADKFINARLTRDSSFYDPLHNTATFSSAGMLILVATSRSDFTIIPNTTVYYKILVRK